MEEHKDSMVILMRHAITGANIEKKKYKVDGEVTNHEVYKSIKLNKDLRDTEIGEEGIKQWEKLSELVKDIKVHTVFVSSLRRSLQTAYYVFKDHELFKNIKFVLMPKLREITNSTHAISVNILDVVDEYKRLLPNFDSSELNTYEDPLHYFIEDIDEDAKDEIKSKLEVNEDDCIKSNAIDLIIDLLGMLILR